MAEYEDSVAFLGEWGPFQRSVFFLLCVSVVPNGFTVLSIVFIGDTPSHRCLVPAEANLTAVWRNNTAPLEEKDGALVFSQCSRYQLGVIKGLSDGGLSPGLDVNLSHVPREACLDGWEYDQSTYMSTIVSEWDLVCDNSWKAPLTSSVFFVGVLTGSCVSGQLSDRYGRKLVLFVTIAIQALFSFIQVFSTSWPVFCALFFVVGMGHISNYVSAFVLGMELFNPVVRTFFSTAGTCLFFALGYMLLPLTAYYIRDWRMLLLTLNVPCAIYLPSWWFVPESPRWLLSQGRVEEAEAILRKAAKRNRVEAPLVIFDPKVVNFKATQNSAVSMLDLLRFGNIRLISVTLWQVWTVLSISYFALSLNTSNLHGDVYFNCFLSAAIEIPAYTLSWVMFRCLSRRFCVSSSLFLGGVMLLLTQTVPSDMHFLAIALEMTGKFGVTVAFAIVYAYTAELYPTVLRNTAIGACSMASRIGSISAPYFIYLRSYSVSLPYILVGSLTVMSALLSLLIPETYGMPLPETIADMQRFPLCLKKKKPYKLNQNAEEEKPSGDPGRKSVI